MIQIVSNFLIGIVIVLHIYFMVLEMFLWTKPLGLTIFRQTLEKAKSSAVLAANQGLYNGFLAGGLIWSLLQVDPISAQETKIFFLICVITAGIFGAYTVNKKIFFIQAVPAILALGTLL